eukprot:snap_masked-scaffold_8-processed-gene-14.80-mRNA-1 protein AED:1.00 eAED:1.00 QI:0/-1/0/0/-1/1/1/0/1157
MVFGGFGSTTFGSNNTSNAFGSNNNTGFGSSNTSGGLFGSNNNNNNSSAFGQTTTSSGSSMFGNNTNSSNLFGSNSTTAFGQTNNNNNSGSLFGSNNTTNTFGSSNTNTSTFGTNTGTFGNSGGFGSTSTNTFGTSGTMGQNQGQVQNDYVPTRDSSSTYNNNLQFASITAMDKYRDKSFEELRVEFMNGGASTNSGGIWGNSGTTNTNTNSGGLFGSTNNNNNTSGGLFGANNTNNTNSGGLFGATNNNNNNTNTGGSLFGSSKNNNTSGGLFGANNNNNNNNSSNSGGLFGTNNNNNSGGLFGGSTNNNSGGGLFGGSTNNNSGGGLFGTSNNNTTGNTGGGLFGATNTNNNNNSGGGLFGNSNINTNTSSGGLFGNTKTNNSSGGLFGTSNNNASTGGGLFGNASNNNNNSSSGGLFGNSNNNNSSGGLFANNNNSNSNSNSLFGSSNTNSGSLFSNNNTNNNQNNNNNNTPNNQGLQQALTLSLLDTSSPNSSLLFTPATKQLLLAKQLWSNKSTRQLNPTPKKVDLPLSMKLLQSSPSTQNRLPRRPKPYLNWLAQSKSSPQKKVKSKEVYPLGELPIRRKFTPSKTRTKRYLLGDKTFVNRHYTPPAKFSVPSLNLTPGKKKIEEKKVDTEVDQIPVTRRRINLKAPRLSSAYREMGYSISPDVSEMKFMTDEELGEMENFQIMRKGVGSVKWIDKVDVRELVVDEVVQIENESVEVYGTDTESPEQGEKLNNPAIVTMYNIEKTPDGISDEDFIDFLKGFTKDSLGAEFIQYKDKRWTFRVEHFSKYALDRSALQAHTQKVGFWKKKEFRNSGGYLLKLKGRDWKDMLDILRQKFGNKSVCRRIINLFEMTYGKGDIIQIQHGIRDWRSDGLINWLKEETGVYFGSNDFSFLNKYQKGVASENWLTVFAKLVSSDEEYKFKSGYEAMRRVVDDEVKYGVVWKYLKLIVENVSFPQSQVLLDVSVPELFSFGMFLVLRKLALYGNELSVLQKKYLFAVCLEQVNSKQEAGLLLEELLPEVSVEQVNLLYPALPELENIISARYLGDIQRELQGYVSIGDWVNFQNRLLKTCLERPALKDNFVLQLLDVIPAEAEQKEVRLFKEFLSLRLNEFKEVEKVEKFIEGLRVEWNDGNVGPLLKDVLGTIVKSVGL